MESLSIANRRALEAETAGFASSHGRAMSQLSTWARRAESDFHRHTLAELPDPADYARWLPAAAVEAMLRARKGPDGWYLLAADARKVIKYGLCEAGLTLQFHSIAGFGLQVLKELRRKDA